LIGENADNVAANSNGAGKSSVFDAIYYGLYGKSLRSVPARDLIRRTATDANLSLFFESKGRNYLVQRSIVNGKQKLELSEGGMAIYANNKTELQVELERILGMSPDLFAHVVLMGKGGRLFSELGDAGRKKLIEGVLELQVYEQAASVAGKRIRELEGEMEGIGLRTSMWEGELVRLKERIADEGASGLEWSSSNELEILDNEDQEERVEVELIKARSALDALPALQDSKVFELSDRVKEKIRECKEYQQKLRETGAQGERDFSRQIAEQTAICAQIEGEVFTKNKMYFDEVCPTCGHDVNVLHDGEHSTEEESRKLEEERAALALLEEERELTRMALKDLEDESRIEEVKLEEELALYKSALEEEKARAMRAEAADQRCKHLEEKRDGIRRRLVALRKARNPYSASLKVSRSREEEIEKSLREAGERSTSIGSLLRVEQVLKGMFSPRGIRSLLFESVIPELNDLLNEYVGLVSEGQISVSLSITSETQGGELREEIDFKVWNPTGGGSYESLSSGERGRLDLPLSFALRSMAGRRGVLCNMVLLDEVFENMDTNGVDSIMSLLRHVVEGEGSTIDSAIVITHDDEFSSAFDRVLLAKKKGGGTVVT